MQKALIQKLKCVFLGVTFICLTEGCGNYPSALSSSTGIKWASPDIEMIAITDLPIEDYPLLAKFQKLKSIQYYKNGRSGATDAKLEALANVKLPRLKDIELIAAKSVTDKGVLALSRMPSLKGLSLEGTSITDNACEIMTSKMNLDGVNVANCDYLTMNGLLMLAKSETFKDISIPADKLTEDEVVRLIHGLKSITSCEFVDPKGRLNEKTLEALVSGKGITIIVKRTGALQDLQSTP